MLGKGAMGTVYDGWDPMIQRRVAIKTIHLPEADDSEAAEGFARFKREVQAAGRLTHPNIVRVFDYGEVEDVAYIVMECVDGRTLKDVLSGQGRLPVGTVVSLMKELLAGLEFSHGRGVVHRDIKPANVMITAEGHAKIADFGVARIEESNMTQAGTVMGTPAYMSPEQIVGQVADQRADIYSCGVVLYQLLTGERPFEGNMSEIMHKALTLTPPRPSSIVVTLPSVLDDVVAQAMARRPEDRFASAADFSQALRRLLPVVTPAPFESDEVTLAPHQPAVAEGLDTLPPQRSVAKPRSRLPLFAGVGGVLAVAVCVVVGVFLPTAEPPLREQVSLGRPERTQTLQISAPTLSAPLAAAIKAGTADPVPVVPDSPAAIPRLKPQGPRPESSGQSGSNAQSPINAAPAAPIVQTEIPLTTNRPPPLAVQSSSETVYLPGSLPPRSATSVVPRETSAFPNSMAAQAPQKFASTIPKPEFPVAPHAPPPSSSDQPQASIPSPGSQSPPVLPVTNPSASAAEVEAALAGSLPTIRCSLVRAAVRPDGSVTLNGVAGAGPPLDTVQRALNSAHPSRWEGDIRGFEGPYCPVLDLLRSQDVAGRTEGALVIAQTGGSTRLRDNDVISLQVTMPNFGGYLHVLYLQHDQTVSPLVPGPGYPSQIYSARFQIDLGKPRLDYEGWRVGPPFGTDMIIAVATTTPLFGRAWPETQPIGSYITLLKASIEAQHREGGSVSAAAIVLETLPPR